MSQADDLQRRADDFADRSIAFVQGLPPTMVAQRIGGQLLDASTSIAANFRAARRGRFYAEFTAKIGIASEEADETVFWLNRLRNAGIEGAVATEPLLGEAQELGADLWISGSHGKAPTRQPAFEVIRATRRRNLEMSGSQSERNVK